MCCHSHYPWRIHGGMYANIGGILMESMLPYIAAPWILWVMIWKSGILRFRIKNDSLLIIDLLHGSNKLWIIDSLLIIDHCDYNWSLIYWIDSFKSQSGSHFHQSCNSWGSNSNPLAYEQILRKEITQIASKYWNSTAKKTCIVWK